MPELNFVLPHWLYWLGLVALPLIAMLIYRRTVTDKQQKVSIPIAYGLLLAGGFLGVHRLYLKSPWALAFIALFTAILLVNVQVRDSREGVSDVNNQISLAESKIKRAEKAVKKGRKGAQERLEKAQQSLQTAKAESTTVIATNSRWKRISQGLGLATLLLMLFDLFRIPKLVRERNSTEQDEVLVDPFECPTVEAPGYDPDKERFLFNRWVGRLNGWIGEFVAYWSIIAVVVYYYEVIARYVFNSPTNWAHEGMFLMFGMQYLLAGGYVLREGAHVRVDVLYMNFSARTKAIIDSLTSVFFFIYVLALLVTGWIFFMDSYNVREVSFTEWAIQYWPIKLSLSIGAVLLFLQGLATLIRDISMIFHPEYYAQETSEELIHGA